MPRRPAAPIPTTGAFRRVRLDAAGYHRRVATSDGDVVEAMEWARFGEEVGPLGSQEVMRLESLGALAPAGATVEDVIAEREQRQEAYRIARSRVPETA